MFSIAAKRDSSLTHRHFRENYFACTKKKKDKQKTLNEHYCAYSEQWVQVLLQHTPQSENTKVYLAMTHYYFKGT